MRIEAFRSADGRLRTRSYSSGCETRFSLAEETGAGTLITEFRVNGEILNQVCTDARGADAALSEYLKGVGELDVLKPGGRQYERVKVDAACAKCKGEIVRELDLKMPCDITSVPVVPMFVCKNCKSRYYLLTDGYLERLVQKNAALFEKDEFRERETDVKAFVSNLQEYVIRIFASKRISKLRIGN